MPYAELTKKKKKSHESVGVEYDTPMSDRSTQVQDTLELVQFSNGQQSLKETCAHQYIYICVCV